MELELLHRIQFALTAGYHFIFVPLTIGLITIILFMEARFYFTKKIIYREMTEFWTKLFIINAAIGIVTGIAMEFQFGANWSEYTTYMGDIFASPLAIEALLAFFLEAVFLGLWIFTRHKMGPKMRLMTIFFIALGTTLSAFWIIIANAFMQHPVGYGINPETGKLVLENAWALFTNPYAFYMLAHTILASYAIGAFFVMSLSSLKLVNYNKMQNSARAFWKKSLKYGAVLLLAVTLIQPVLGDQYAKFIAEVQPSKAAAFENVWVTQDEMPFYLIQIPDPENQDNLVEIGKIPYYGSQLYCGSFDCTVNGFDQIPEEDRPSANEIKITFWSFRIMVYTSMIMLVWAVAILIFNRTNQFSKAKWFLYLTAFAVVLPYVASIAGWITAEVGRQPWTVYGLMYTSEAYSPIPAEMVMISITLITLLYLFFFGIFFYFIKKVFKKGPDLSSIKESDWAQYNDDFHKPKIKTKKSTDVTVKEMKTKYKFILSDHDNVYDIYHGDTLIASNVHKEITIDKAALSDQKDITVKLSGGK